jgi:hypothetical protein
MKIRQSPSGPIFTADRVGDILVWDGNEWLPGSGASCVDFRIETLANLPAPVSGVITMESGLYCFSPDVDLVGNRLVVPSGASVKVEHGGVLAAIDGAAVLEIQSGALFEASGFQIQNLTGAATGQAVLCNAAVDDYAFFTRCDFRSTASAGHAISHTDGKLSLTLCQFLAGTTLLELAGATARTYLTQCDLTGSSMCIRVASAHESLFVTGGRWHNFGRGLSVDADIGNINFGSIDLEGFTEWIVRTAGAVRNVQIQGVTANNHGSGITWAAANLPTRQMSILNSFFGNTPFVGFTAADANVFIRSCAGVAGALSETAIVP